ncbi:GATA zinc finger domain-containing protein 4 [Manduca sexta]|uniref:GATA zinc finger domain-containing protein 4 n=1 Tax=Manduca sexta TaxID=7130 RepID=UPI00188DCC09|nr:GATA zinc finger domain-containing protein 4 [Manduca sexta]
MRKNKENNFAHKFRLLNSQESTNDINWSLSSSSDEETSYSNVTYCNITNRQRYTKRKRSRKPSNIANLDIAVLENTSTFAGDKSPILCDNKSIKISPVLESKSLQRSPILMPRNSQKSPILHQNSLKVNRKLFNNNENLISTKINGGTFYRQNIGNKLNTSNNTTENQCISKINASNASENGEKHFKHDIYRKVKCFFESNFTQDNASQNSISDETTPKESAQSEEIEISSGTTDHETSSVHKCVISAREEKVNKDVTKKIKYKKDGYAYRLNALLKKQNASRSLWQHEKFLADNSNFVIPKEAHVLFRHTKAISEYGCTVLNAVDENDQHWSVVINNVYLNEKIGNDSIIKIYKPYNVVEVDGHKWILNVFKYDHLTEKIGE